MLWRRSNMVKVEREDFDESFVTILRFIDGNKAQEIQVYAWEADIIENKLKNIDLATVNALKSKKGKKIIKKW